MSFHSNTFHSRANIRSNLQKTLLKLNWCGHEPQQETMSSMADKKKEVKKQAKKEGKKETPKK
ncbi:hypothetical protein V511_05450 [Mesotoga sp. Brook.08.YT.4.2.5.1]|nr:hypothetical protein V511_05450 [Mesotoga sp. Brook.08.YT.4.2.5.1]PNS39758.1 hypothetical protein RJ60_08485 [Mesotoga sp. B105.6.4]PVD18046.1 hypothetical protein V512_014310 [Mesotoga sp. Brook.08.105.5.1]RAO95497.1 hypothetical protein M388_06485 [Mesotoga sp. Brook.08.YT.4.2.5.4.]RDI92948.1 hypothetical protein Q502_08850 [Mesotoga sp. Brook.08.YT.4.2.5.2.]